MYLTCRIIEHSILQPAPGFEPRKKSTIFFILFFRILLQLALSFFHVTGFFFAGINFVDLAKQCKKDSEATTSWNCFISLHRRNANLNNPRSKSLFIREILLYFFCGFRFNFHVQRLPCQVEPPPNVPCRPQKFLLLSTKYKTTKGEGEGSKKKINFFLKAFLKFRIIPELK